MTPKWEYEFVDTDPEGQILNNIHPGPVIEIAANALGKEGWELMAAVPRQDKKGYQYCFKRLVQAE